MELINFLKKIFNCQKGVTFVEIMLAVSILAISMTYVAYDSKFSAKAIYELNQEEKMFYAAQTAIEKYKLDKIAGTKNIEGYTVDVSVVNDPVQDSNLTTYLQKVTFTVHPKNSDSGIGDIVVVSYVFSSVTQPPSAPTNLIATPTVNSIVLNWNEPAYAESYNVKRSEVPGGPYTTIAENITVPTYTDNTALKQVTYYYVVSAVNSYGESPNSNEVSVAIEIYTTALNPIDDSYIRGGSYSSDNYGTSRNLYVRDFFWTRHVYKSYFKFDLSTISGTVLDAKLRLYGRDTTGRNMNVDIHSLSNDTWDELTITWDNAPAEQGIINTMVFDNISKYVEANVKDYCITQYKGDKIISFVLTTQEWDIGEISSKEGVSKPELVITWTPYAPPPAPQKLTAIEGNKQVTLKWDTVIGAESYNIKRSFTSGGPYTIIKSGVVTTNYTDTGLTNGTTYYYVVSAQNGNGESPNSNEVSATPNLITTVVYNPDADAYVRGGSFSDINYGSSQYLESNNASLGSSERRVAYLKFDLSNLRGEVVNAKLRLYGSNVEDSSQVSMGCYEVSNNSWEENVITYNTAPVLGNKIGRVIVDDIQTYREIDITDYVKSKMSTDKIVNVAVLGEGTAKLLSFKSKESLLNKPELILRKTLLKPNPPENLKAVPDDRKVTLSWTASDETDYYVVYRSTIDGGPYGAIATKVLGTSYDDTAVTNGTKYYYVITAVNGTGESSYSEQVSATPNPALTVTFNPIADATVESYYPSNNYGNSPLLAVSYNGTNNKKSYFKFDLSGYSNNTVVSAVFRIYGSSNVDSFKLNAYRVSDNRWKETGTGAICWNNAPPLEAQVASTTVNTVRKYNEIDLTDYISTSIDSSGLVSFGLYTDVFSQNAGSFNSKEDSYMKPELVVKMILGVPKQPKNLRGIGGDGTAELSWEASDGAESYKVKRSTTSGGPYTTVASNITETTYCDTGLKNNTAYYYVVTGINDIGESINSNEVCVIPQKKTSSQILFPSSDSYVRDGIFSTSNLGGEAVINVSTSSTPEERRKGYIKFDLSSVIQKPSEVQLIITGMNITDNKPIILSIYRVSNDIWSEYTLNWNNAPGEGAFIGSFSVGRNPKTVNIDVTSYVAAEWIGDKQVSFCIKSETNDRVASFSSKEGTYPPMLQITY